MEIITGVGAAVATTLILMALTWLGRTIKGQIATAQNDLRAEMQQDREQRALRGEKIDARLDFLASTASRHEKGIISDGQRIAYLEGKMGVPYKAGEQVAEKP